MSDLPTITIRGSLVTVSSGPDVTTHPCESHDAAIALAADIEDAARADRQARADLLARYVAEGVDVVVPEGFDETVDVIPAPAPALAPAAEPPAPVVEAIVPTASDSGPEIGSAGDQSPPADPPVTIEVDRYDPATQRLMLRIHAHAAVTLYRSAGDRSAVFELAPTDEPVSRWFKADVGDSWVLRLGAEDGPIVAEGVIE